MTPFIPTLTQNTSKAVNAALDAQFATDQGQRNAAMDKDHDKWLQQQALSTITDLNKIQDIEDAKRADQTLARIEAVNAQSAALQTQTNVQANGVAQSRIALGNYVEQGKYYMLGGDNGIFDQHGYVPPSPIAQGWSKGNSGGLLNTALLDAELKGYFDANSFMPSDEDMAGYKTRQSFFTNATAYADSIDVGADTLTTMLGAGWATSASIGKQADMFWFDPKLTMHQNWSFAGDSIGKLSLPMGGLSIASSVFGAINETYYNPNGFDYIDAAREGIKVGVDAASLATAAPQLAKFTPLGWLYTAADVAVQLTPDYAIKYGAYRWESRSGWTKLMYMHSDARQSARESLSPEAYYQTHVRPTTNK